MKIYRYDQGYDHGMRDAKDLRNPRVPDQGWYGQGYRDGYLSAKKLILAGKPVLIESPRRA